MTLGTFFMILFAILLYAIFAEFCFRERDGKRDPDLVSAFAKFHYYIISVAIGLWVVENWDMVIW